MRLRETTADTRDSDRQLDTHETQRDYWILMRLRETNGDQWELMRLRETTGYS